MPSTRAIADAGIDKTGVTAVMIGTTHFTNAVVERKHLARTAAVRLCLPAAQCLPPMVDWPDDIREAVGGQYWMAKGGNEFDGRSISELDMAELDGIAEEIGAAGIGTVAITSVFSPVSDKMERAAMERLAERLPGVDFTLSSEIGRLGILERENAAIMNASLRGLSERTVAAFGRALHKVGLDCPYYITQNDGTLMSREFVQSYPVLTFASGPTNSMRGAAFLSGTSDAIVVDVGGTTTDVGALVKGFPRPASTTVDVGGVRTNFRMPDVFAIGLGGGTIVAGEGENLKVGPQSVGYKLTEEALIFGGKTLTTSDVAVALGLADFGDKAAVADLRPKPPHGGESPHRGDADQRGGTDAGLARSDPGARGRRRLDPGARADRRSAGGPPAAFLGRQRRRRRDRADLRRGRPDLLAGEQIARRGAGRGAQGGHRQGDCRRGQAREHRAA